MSIIFLFTWFFIQNSFTSISSSIYFCSLNSTCGCSLKSTVVTKIIGGAEADIDNWGWAVSIRLRNSHICGGSLISPELVVTAAHCFVSVDAISKLSVTAGSTYLNDINQQRSISEIFIHRKYDSKSFTNDIAVIRLSTPFNMKSNSLALICLSTKIIESKSNDTNAMAIGWGVVSVHSQVPSNALRQVALKTIANTDITCSRSIKNIQVQFCAGVSGGGKDTCQGDSGGPLMIVFDKRWYLIGITSFGVGCALSTHAGVYTKVSVYEQVIGCVLKNDTLCANKIFMIRNSVSSISICFYMNRFFIVLLYLITHFT